VAQIGDKGVTLSGGQKQRIALARAVYSSSRIVLLDDCLSAVDSPTAQHIFERCLTGGLMRGRTCVLVTHHVGLTLAKADFVVVLRDGRVVASGPPSQVQSMALAADVAARTSDEPGDETGDETESEAARGTAAHKARGSGALVAEEEREIGQVKWPVYKYFFDAAGGGVFWTVAIGMVVLSQALYALRAYWIRTWANSGAGPSAPAAPAVASVGGLWVVGAAGTSTPVPSTLASAGGSVEYYLTVFAMLGAASVLAMLVYTLILCLGRIHAARRTHHDLLHRIVHAKPRFFDVTPLGRIMNRFSKDMAAIDIEVVTAISMVILNGTALLAAVGAIVYATPAFLVAGVAIAGLVLADGKLYVRASRDLKRIESVTMSPMMSLFGEIIQ
jgi:ABC-type multidrug transport system fused ATPase/permease subunit